MNAGFRYFKALDGPLGPILAPLGPIVSPIWPQTCPNSVPRIVLRLIQNWSHFWLHFRTCFWEAVDPESGEQPTTFAGKFPRACLARAVQLNILGRWDNGSNMPWPRGLAHSQPDWVYPYRALLIYDFQTLRETSWGEAGVRPEGPWGEKRARGDPELF